MEPSKTTLERAFELASSGRFNSAADIRRVLAREGYQSSQLTGPTLMKQLRQLIQQAHSEPASDSPE